MQTYLVGGAVRDQLLGRRFDERDWVVVGATDVDMRRLDSGKLDATFLCIYTRIRARNTP